MTLTASEKKTHSWQEDRENVQHLELLMHKKGRKKTQIIKKSEYHCVIFIQLVIYVLF
uniref:Uncharacterized protein n=1 Tax=Anguilla anguilla TaxID=7936 RepID=A0A0E9WTH9_ANGAN